MPRLPKAAPKMFPEPEHSAEFDTQKFYDQMRADPYDAPDGEYPEWLPAFLHQAYNRAFNRDTDGMPMGRNY